jgi:hypothetical protein
VTDPIGYTVAEPASRMIPDPTEWYQKSAGGPWYRVGAAGRNAYHVRPCERCGQEALMEGKRRFCSRSCAKRKDDPGYDTRHHRVKWHKGSACQYGCVDCGAPANDWSQIHGTTGADPEHYEPRCRKCHALYDLDTRFLRGERNPRSKLTEAQRLSIHAATTAGVGPQALARQFGVSKGAIQGMLRSASTRRRLEAEQADRRERYKFREQQCLT